MTSKVKINWVDIKSKAKNEEIKPNNVEPEPTKQPVKIELEEPVKVQQQPRQERKEFNIDEYISQKINQISLKEPSIKVNDLQIQPNIKVKKPRRFNFEYVNPLSGILQNYYLLGGAAIGIILISNKLL